MKAEEAIKETGMAEIGKDSNCYAFVGGDGVLYWNNEGKTEPVPFVLQVCDQWFSYHKEPLIVPSEPGELWRNDGVYYLTVRYDCNLTFISKFASEYLLKKAVHGQNGWTRIHPKVENPNIERVVIEGANYRDYVKIGEYHDETKDYRIFFACDEFPFELTSDKPEGRLIFEYDKVK